MFGWGVSLAIAASAAILLILIIILAVRRCYCFSKQGTKVSEATATLPQIRANMEGLQSQRMPRPSYNLFRRGPSTKPLFSWGDHPSLIADAIENGWSRFAFTNYSSSSTARSPLLGCVEREPQAEMTWEVEDGSVDFMQKIRMNPGTKRFSSNCSSMAVKSAIRTALPLPGPPMGNPYSFPQEAYFEITLLCVSSSPGDHQIKAEGEKTKLIGDKISDGKGNLDALDEVKAGGRATVMISVGLTSSSLVPLKIPGSYHGSIGFNSDGSIYLDGTKLVLESEKEDWGQEEKVIGCGFDPRQKKVFFTVDSKLVEAVHCKSEEFGVPLYPIIAANVDVTVLVNMGQSRFSYEPANEVRTPNPCFIGPALVRSPAALGFEDSGELFSMGRIDSGWHHHCNGNNGSKADEDDGDDDGESEADLFEIVLDVDGKSANV